MKVICPGCRDAKNEVLRESPFFPFCSERCRNGDLTRWMNEGYRVAGDPAGPGDLTELPSEDL